ncbi:TrkH family potassium uptake protein [Thermocrispum municipale]|uniref:TrkH family potassium uptake protein n=1 Tax=Thermocrispum municipale TaxID=37926 RepID=UPI000410E2F4|nr:potassium transporter TrkG [Thermocrispum municipale]
MIERGAPGDPPSRPLTPVASTRRALSKLMPSGGHPTRAVLTLFAGFILFGTVVLMLPFSTTSGKSTDFVTALFTSTSAVCVTGLTVVDTEFYWSEFGHVVLLVLMQIGGIGIVTIASVLGLLVARRFSLRMQMTMQAEMRGIGFVDVRRIVTRVVIICVVIESILAVILTIRLVTAYGQSFGRALYSGVFHSVSTFTGGGFSLHSDSLARYAGDGWVSVPVAVVGIIAGIGFPVLFELGRRAKHPRRWSLHTKITLLTSAILLVVGFVFLLVAEWANPRTFGPMGVGAKIVSALFGSVVPRSIGLTTIDVSDMHSESLLLYDVLMFIGGGSASTAGGIKVTTFALLAFVIWAEIRGEPTVHVMGRRLSPMVQRQALTVALLGVGLVMSTTMVVLALTDIRLERVLFEVISAFGTVGLSTGVTGELPTAGVLILAAVMFVGRIGPITTATALALRERRRRYELPEERPIVG